MGRIYRSRLGRGCYHVMNRSLDGRFIFSKPEDHQLFIDLLLKFSIPLKLNIYHWAVMSNHFHIALEVMTTSDLSTYIGKVCRRYSILWHNLYGGKGTIWQGRFKSILIQKEGYLERLGRYIERNPVRAKMANINFPWDYKWSSARCYSLGEPDNLVNEAEHPFWYRMGDSDSERMKYYRQYLLSESERVTDEKLFRENTLVIGEQSFINNIQQRNGRVTSRKRGYPRK